MTDAARWLFIADAILTFHIALVLFVIVGPFAIVLGHFRGWRWADAAWFRWLHLALIGVIVAESWFGVVCPLTGFEMHFRAKARAATYEGGFIDHWLQQLLYYNGPPWVFTLCYSVFLLLVVATWWFFPPRRRTRAAVSAA